MKKQDEFPFKKLNDKQVSLIRELYKYRENGVNALAKQFSVDRTTIWRVVKEKTHKHLTEGNENG